MASALVRLCLCLHLADTSRAYVNPARTDALRCHQRIDGPWMRSPAAARRAADARRVACAAAPIGTLLARDAPSPRRRLRRRTGGLAMLATRQALLMAPLQPPSGALAIVPSPWRLLLLSTASFLLALLLLPLLELLRARLLHGATPPPPFAPTRDLTAALARITRAIAKFTASVADAVEARHLAAEGAVEARHLAKQGAGDASHPATRGGDAAGAGRRRAAVEPAAAAAEAAAAPSDRAALEKMRVKQLKAELVARGVPHADCVEKFELVDRLLRARRDAPASPPPPAASPPQAMPSGIDNPAEAMAQIEKLMEEPEGRELMMQMQGNPVVMNAAMDIAANGEAAAQKYAHDPEVVSYLQRLEKLMTDKLR
ncbi:hypothetical protein AB1Y20_021044 [Prymnesium parvum]|uniref:STI1 domain-containing protein n=1 Tax=Prymnesium parvum TaxID=97485 RepID=A0AB34JK79_PRYPA